MSAFSATHLIRTCGVPEQGEVEAHEEVMKPAETMAEKDMYQCYKNIGQKKDGGPHIWGKTRDILEKRQITISPEVEENFVLDSQKRQEPKADTL